MLIATPFEDHMALTSLYPGEQTERPYKKGPEERVLPSIGAFSVKPNKDDDGVETSEEIF